MSNTFFKANWLVSDLAWIDFDLCCFVNKIFLNKNTIFVIHKLKPNRAPDNTMDNEYDFESMIAQRNRFLESCHKSRLYNNPVYKEPWKVFSAWVWLLKWSSVDSYEQIACLSVSLKNCSMMFLHLLQAITLWQLTGWWMTFWKQN